MNTLTLPKLKILQADKPGDIVRLCDGSCYLLTSYAGMYSAVNLVSGCLWTKPCQFISDALKDMDIVAIYRDSQITIAA